MLLVKIKIPNTFLFSISRYIRTANVSLIYLIFPVCAFVRLLVRGIKNGHLIGRSNDVTVNMAALAVFMCLATSHLRHSVLLSLGLPGTMRTCAEVYCHCLVRGNCSGY